MKLAGTKLKKTPEVGLHLMDGLIFLLKQYL